MRAVLVALGGLASTTTVVAEPVAPETPRSRFRALALVHLDVLHGGAAGFAGGTFDLTRRLQVHAAAIIGPNLGGYAGARFAILTGRIRPIVAAGMPVFVSDGARFALRGAGGIEWQIHRRVAVIAELGIEYVVNPEADITGVPIFVPAIGASARM
jgi:hypothetical protein